MNMTNTLVIAGLRIGVAILKILMILSVYKDFMAMTTLKSLAYLDFIGRFR